MHLSFIWKDFHAGQHENNPEFVMGIWEQSGNFHGLNDTSDWGCGGKANLLYFLMSYHAHLSDPQILCFQSHSHPLLSAVCPPPPTPPHKHFVGLRHHHEVSSLNVHWRTFRASCAGTQSPKQSVNFFHPQHRRGQGWPIINTQLNLSAEHHKLQLSHQPT